MTLFNPKAVEADVPEAVATYHEVEVMTRVWPNQNECDDRKKDSGTNNVLKRKESWTKGAII